MRRMPCEIAGTKVFNREGAHFALICRIQISVVDCRFASCQENPFTFTGNLQNQPVTRNHYSLVLASAVAFFS